jgi:flagellar hook-basal body complex protein FliE
MTIGSIFTNFKPIESITQPIKPGEKPGIAENKNFSDMLGNAMKEVDTLQKSADKQIEGLVLGADNVTPHGAMIALEKADMAFQMMNSVRSKIIRAYEEIIRTQV